jgi:hypothetical protein
VGGVVQELAGSFDANQNLLTARPPAPLTPGAHYQVGWPALKRVSTGARGLGGQARFTAGAGPDREPPRFEGLTDVSWDQRRLTNECTGSLESRYAFDLSLGAADDDGGRGSLVLQVFQTVGPRLGAGPRPVLSRAMPAAGERARVELPVEESVGRVCFAAVARDLRDDTAGGDREVCTETIAPPFFYGCALLPARRPASSSAAGALPVLALAAALVRRRRRRR